MSVKALSAVFEHSRAKDSAFVVALSLADWADQNGRCYPSYGQIAEKARVSRATAVTAIQQLIDLGEWSRIVRGTPPTPDDEGAPSNVRAQHRNTYQCQLIRPGKVVQPLDHPSKNQVVQPLDHQQRDQVIKPLDHQVVQRYDHPADAADAQVVQPAGAGSPTDESHKRNRPSDQPSVLKAGASAPRSEKAATKKEDERSDDDPLKNVGVITRIVHDILDHFSPDPTDLPELVKQSCASFDIRYNSEAVIRAIESADYQRVRVGKRPSDSNSAGAAKARFGRRSA